MNANLQEKPQKKRELKFTYEIDGLIIRDEKNETAFLNLVATRIWELCDGKNSVEDIARIVASEYDIDLETVTKDVSDFIQELRKKNFLKERSE